MSPYISHFGEPFKPVVMAAKGKTCRLCGGALQRGQKAAQFPHQPPHYQFECSDCVYAGFVGVNPPWKEQ